MQYLHIKFEELAFVISMKIREKERGWYERSRYLLPADLIDHSPLEGF